MNTQKSASSGISIGTVLFLIFLVLKLADIGQVANWSWWWVTSPLWIPVLLAGAFIIVAVFIAVIIKLNK
jgi:small Trp-rich protein